MEFSVPLWGEGEDVNLSWLPLQLALGQHARSVHTAAALTGLLTLPASRPRPKNPWQLTHLLLLQCLFSDTEFVASQMLYLCNLFTSLARHSSVPPTPPSPLNFHFLCEPLSQQIVSATPSLHPTSVPGEQG